MTKEFDWPINTLAAVQRQTAAAQVLMSLTQVTS